MNRLLITGGAGFIGSNFTHHWLQYSPQDLVIVLDKLTYAGNLDNLKALEQLPNFIFIHGDIGDENLVSSIFHQYQTNILVNFAAESHVDRSIQSADAFITTNVVGTYNLLKVAKKFWLDNPQFDNSIHRFHHVSTDEVYGSLAPHDPGFTENSPFQPNSPYAASKAAADHLVRAFHVTYGLNTTISNCSNNFGPYHFPEKLIPLTVLKILHGEPVPIYGDGLQVRDWLHVTDHCRAIELIIKQGKSGESYNIGGHEGESTNLALAHKIFALINDFFVLQPERKQYYAQAFPAQALSVSHAIQYVTDRLGHDRRYAINSTKIIKELGFKYSIDFEEGLKQTVLWFLNNKAWWQKLYAAPENILNESDVSTPMPS